MSNVCSVPGLLVLQIKSKAFLSYHTHDQPVLQNAQHHNNKNTPIRLHIGTLVSLRRQGQQMGRARAAELPKAAATRTAALIRDAGDADDAAALPTPVSRRQRPSIRPF